MHIVYDEQQLASLIQQEMVYPMLIDEYVRAKEGEFDAICDGHNVFVPTIIEHVEKQASIPVIVMHGCLPNRLRKKKKRK